VSALLLEVRDLSLSLDGKEILRDVSLAVRAGVIHALVGPNGAGKSSLAYCVMGLSGYGPQSGEIVFAGRSLAGLSVDERARLGLSLAWQEPARFEGLSVRQFLRAAARDAQESSLREALRKVALDPDRYMDRLVDATLSGGERKRIELASIVAMRPRLMIADEPDSGIDVAALQRMFELFEWLRREGTTVLLVTHSSEVMGHADTATLICHGRVVDEGPAAQIRRYFVDNCLPCPYEGAAEARPEP